MVYYEESAVKELEMEEWVRGVEHSRLLNLLWVSHYHRTSIKKFYVHQLLTLVHNGCIWLGGPILIIDILIHKIMHLRYKGTNPTKEFGGKTRENDLAERMKRYYGLMKKSRGYSIMSITNLTVQLATQILAGKLMMKCHADEVPTLVVSLAT